MPIIMEDYLTRDMKPQISAFLKHVDGPELMTDTHWHDWYEVLYVLDGEIEQVINGQHTLLGQGDMVVIQPLDVHATLSTNGGTALFVMLFSVGAFNLNDYSQTHSKYLSVFTESAGMETCLLRSPYTSQGEIRHTLERMCYAFYIRETGYEMMLRGLLYQFISYVQQNGRLLWAAGQQHTEGARINEICKYVEAHVRTHLTVEQVARDMGYSKEYLSRYFKKATGRNIKQFIDYVKINEAELILQFEDLPIHLIASALGFENPSNFTRTFKRLKGYSPSSIRYTGHASGHGGEDVIF